MTTLARLDADDEDRWSPSWRPDPLLVPAILAGSPTTLKSLSAPDGAWAIANLRLMGYTADFIAERLGCALRTVRTISADAGVLVALYLAEAETFDLTNRMQSGEITRLATLLEVTEAERDRYLDQLRRMLDTLMTEGKVEAFPCGCPRTRYNTYTAPKTGKQGCREHRRLAVARHRARRKLDSTPAMSVDQPGGVGATRRG